MSSSASAAAGVPEANISFARDTYYFHFAGTPAEFVSTFREYYGPTMNAFEAAEANGRTAELQNELEALFEEKNESTEHRHDHDPRDVPARDGRGLTLLRRVGRR